MTNELWKISVKWFKMLLPMAFCTASAQGFMDPGQQHRSVSVPQLLQWLGWCLGLSPKGSGFMLQLRIRSSEAWACCLWLTLQKPMY